MRGGSQSGALSSSTRRQPNFGTPICYKYGRWAMLRHNPGGMFRNSSVSIKLPGLLRDSTSVARFPDGSISVQMVKSTADDQWDQGYVLDPMDPRTFWGSNQASFHVCWTTVAGAATYLAGAGIKECIRDPKDVIAIWALQGHMVDIPEDRDALGRNRIPGEEAKDMVLYHGTRHEHIDRIVVAMLPPPPPPLRHQRWPQAS